MKPDFPDHAPNPGHSTTSTLLVVDDNPMDRALVAALVKKELGWEVVCVEDGIQALLTMRQSRPEIVLTDLQMPGMTGLELVELARREFPHTPVVLMTAYGSEMIALDALRRGAASYVRKSWIETDLASTLEQVWATARQESETHAADQRLVRARFDFKIENDLGQVRGLGSRIKQYLQELAQFGHGDVMRIGIAVEEALLNALYHGNLEVSSDLKQGGDAPFLQLATERGRLAPYRDRRIFVTAEFSPESAAFVIRDEGPGFDVRTLPDPTDPENLCKPSGRGTMLIQTFMDQVSYNYTGNEVTLRKLKTEEAPALSS